MNIDVERLVVSVQCRPALYDFRMKEHSNKDVMDNLWEEVGKEINATGSDCRLKWQNLRSSYSRYLREIKNPSGLTKKMKRKWYLADAMSFLADFMNQSKGTASNIECTDHVDIVELVCKQELFEDPNPFHSKPHSSSLRSSTSNKHSSSLRSSSSSKKHSSSLRSPSSNKHSSSLRSSSSKNPQKQSPAEVVAAPIATFLETNSESQTKDQESPLVNFFRVLLPDIEKLSPKRQRVFKGELVRLVNKLVDEQEEDTCAIPSTASSSTFRERTCSPPNIFQNISNSEHNYVLYETFKN